MPFRHRETAPYGYVVELDYVDGTSDSDSAGTVKKDAIEITKSYKDDKNVVEARLYPKNAQGEVDARADPIYTGHWKRNKD